MKLKMGKNVMFTMIETRERRDLNHAVPEDRSDSLNSNPRGIAKSMFV